MAERTVGGAPPTTSTRVTGGITPGIAAGGSARAGRLPAPAARARVVRRRLGHGGLVGAMLLFCLSLTPSLLPRSWLLQGVLGGLTAALGYGLGPSVGRAVRGCAVAALDAWPAPGLAVLAVISVVLVGLFLWLGARWQADVRALMGMDGYVAWSALGILVLAAAVFGLLLLLARASAWGPGPWSVRWGGSSPGPSGLRWASPSRSSW